MYYQRTIENETTCVGIGLHSGEKVKLKILPAPPDTGIVFILKDMEIPAKALLVNKVDYATTLSRGEKKVKTVEHLLATFYGLQVDNAYVEIDNIEVPIMDGSAAPFVFLIEEAKIKVQDKPRPYLKILTPLYYEEGDKSIKVVQSDEFRITYYVSYNHALISEQTITLPITSEIFKDQIAPARTFGFLYEVEQLRKVGLTLGGSKDNAVVLDDHKVLNERLRFKNEFVRHKVLDLMGDLSLCGYQILGHIFVKKGGHSIHTKMAQMIKESIQNQMITFLDDSPSYTTQPFA